MNTEELIESYVKLRDAKADLVKEQREALKPYDDGLETLEGLLMQALEAAGADSLKTKAGTVYRSTWTSARVDDWAATLDYILDSERYDLLERRVAKTVVEEIGTVPGVSVEKGVRVNVRRA